MGLTGFVSEKWAEYRELGRDAFFRKYNIPIGSNSDEAILRRRREEFLSAIPGPERLFTQPRFNTKYELRSRGWTLRFSEDGHLDVDGEQGSWEMHGTNLDLEWGERAPGQPTWIGRGGAVTRDAIFIECIYFDPTGRPIDGELAKFEAAG
jgi:hypothetical protein